MVQQPPHTSVVLIKWSLGRSPAHHFSSELDIKKNQQKLQLGKPEQKTAYQKDYVMRAVGKQEIRELTRSNIARNQL